jgi:hypothetical protein
VNDDHWPDLPDEDAPLDLPDDLHNDFGLHDLYDDAHEHGPVHEDHDLPAPEPEHEPPAHDEIVLDLQHDEVPLDLAAVGGDALAETFGVDHAAYDDVVARLGLPAALDSHSAAVVLGELGLDAAVEHGDLDSLAASVADGEEVVLTGPQGRLTVTAVGDGVVELTAADGSTSQVDVAAFESAWEQASYAMVVAEPAAAAGEVVLATGPVPVLGLSWPPS